MKVGDLYSNLQLKSMEGWVGVGRSLCDSCI